MNATKTLVLTGLEWLAAEGDLERCRVRWRLVEGDGPPDGAVTVVIARALVRQWQLDADDVAAELVAQARERLADAIFHGTLRPAEEVRLTAPSAVRLCPYDPLGAGPPLGVPLRFVVGAAAG